MFVSAIMESDTVQFGKMNCLFIEVTGCNIVGKLLETDWLVHFVATLRAAVSPEGH